MKNILVILLLASPFFLMAQSGTSADEYKYLTKGYAYQKEMGLDGKMGYDVKSLFRASNGVSFSGLLHTSSNEMRGVLVVIERAEGKPHYLCLPNNNSSNAIKGMFENELKQKLSLLEKEVFDKALLEFSMSQLSGNSSTNYIGETEKNLNKNQPDSYDIVVPMKTEMHDGTMTSIDNSTVTQKSGSSNLPINQKVVTLVKLDNRVTLSAPIVRGSHSKKGTVVIKICVDADGNIKTAKFTQRGSNTFNKNLKQRALNASQEAKFNSSLEKEQCGTITYKFE